MNSCFVPYEKKVKKYYEPQGYEYELNTSDFILKDSEGNMEATMFSYSYMKLPHEENRPVMFAYNGGPGADSNWVHLGFLGPKNIHISNYPYLDSTTETTLKENRNFLLDVCDIVLINPAGTEHTYVTEKGKIKYFNSDGDCNSFVLFIEDWLRKNGRQNSPVYLAGESYGTIRNLVVASRLPDYIHLAGIIFIGVSWNVGAKSISYVEPNVRRLGANAATNWFHNLKNKIPFDAFIEEAISFAYGQYAHILLIGNNASEEEVADTAEKLSYYSGMDKDFLLKNHLRFSEPDYLNGFSNTSVISTYDSRIESPKTGEQVREPGADGDPFMDKVGSKFDHLMKEYASEIPLPPEREKCDINDIYRLWSFASIPEDTMKLPETLLRNKKKLCFMIANGYYDMQSTFDFVLYYLSQHDMPEERTFVKFYQGGHACYVGDTTEALQNDVRDFVKKSLEINS